MNGRLIVIEWGGTVGKGQDRDGKEEEREEKAREHTERNGRRWMLEDDGMGRKCFVEIEKRRERGMGEGREGKDGNR